MLMIYCELWKGDAYEEDRSIFIDHGRGLHPSRGLYAQYRKEGASFVPKYKKLLYTTPIATAEDTAKTAGIDLTDKNFWRSALQIIADDIDRFCELVENSQ